MSCRDLHERFDIVDETIDLGAFTLELTKVRDVNALIDAIGPNDFGPDERLPYWASLWPSSVALARHFVATGPPPSPVLELGAGLGLVSLALAALGADVVATDYETDALAFLRRSAEKNGLAVATEVWDFRDPARFGPFPTVVGSDLLYEARQVAPVAARLSQMVAPGGAAILADPGRPHLAAFERALGHRQFAMELAIRDDIIIIYATRCAGGGATDGPRDQGPQELAATDRIRGG